MAKRRQLPDAVAAMMEEALRQAIVGGGGNPKSAATDLGRRPQDISDADDDFIPPEYSDESLALHFAKQYAGTFRYVAAWSKWYLWESGYWRPDETLFALDCARYVCRDEADRCDKPKVATAIASASTVAAVERLGRTDRRLAATVDQWDADPWLLSSPEGTIDLRTGRTRRHSPLDYITRSVAVAPEGECPTWLTFLEEVTGGDDEFISYLQRLCGYSLTGLTSEHSLVFIYGPGGNGKSVFLDTVSGILAGYHRSAPIEAFTASPADRHPTELAMLRGARFVTAIETEEGRRWAESRIKALTGGDKIVARFMRQDFFEFVPQFKLVIAGNHKPGLRSVDEAIRRRFHLVPFSVVIPPDKRDPDLKDKLRIEWPGILAWMIRGCMDWQEKGLAPPRAVLTATAEYLEAEDAISTWIEERCQRDPNAWTSRGDLFASWRGWAEGAGEFVGSQKRFLQSLEAHGFQPLRKNNGRGFVGLSINRLDETSPHWSDQ